MKFQLSYFMSLSIVLSVGLAAIPMIIGAYLFDKSEILSWVFLFAGFILIVGYVAAQVWLKNKEIDKSWQKYW